MLEHLQDMKIRARLLVSYAVIIAICLAASIAALFLLNKIGNNLSSFYNNNYTVTVNVWMAKREMQAARADILNAILDSDMDDANENVTKANNHLGNMRAAFPVIRKSFKGDIALVDQVDSLLEQAIVYRDQVFELIEADQRGEAYQVMKFNPASGSDVGYSSGNSRRSRPECEDHGGGRGACADSCNCHSNCHHGIKYCVSIIVWALYFQRHPQACK